MTDPVSASMESIIAAALAGHWSFSTDTDDYPRFVDRCDGCHEIVFKHGRENNQNQSYAAHQARAVLAAISEAGNVQFGVKGEGRVKEYGRDRRRAQLAARGRGATFVTRRVTAWTAVEG